jgi:hypothetical protein
MNAVVHNMCLVFPKLFKLSDRYMPGITTVTCVVMISVEYKNAHRTRA